MNGTISAKNFLVKEMGPGGFVIGSSAAIAAAPNDFRSGTLDLRAGAAAGSVLLDVRRNAPATLDQLVFLNTPGVVGAFNVKTDPSSVPVSLTNWTGALSGPSFESDPNGLITWNVQAAPVLAAFHAVPGAEKATLVWTMSTQTAVTGYQLRRATSAAGPFPVLTSFGLAGPTYAFVDQPLAGSHTAVSVSASPRVAVQRSAIQGGTGLNVAAGSFVAVSSGSLSSLVSTGSNVEMANLTPGSTSVSPPASLVTRSGPMPNVDLPELIPLSLPSHLSLDGLPSSTFIIIASPRIALTPFPQFEMPVLVDLVSLVMLPPGSTDALGHAIVPFEVSPEASLLGFTYVVQAAVLDTGSGTWRFSNVETMTAIP